MTSDEEDRDERTSNRLVLRSLDRVEAALTAVQTQINDLATRYVSRHEMDNRMEGMNADRVQLNTRLAAFESAREVDRRADREHLDALVDKIEERRQADRRFTISSLTTLALLALGLLTLIVTHWK